MNFSNYINKSIKVFEKILQAPHFQQNLDRAVEITAQTLRSGLPLLVCGNGGSAADAQHIAGELVGRYLTERRALNVICLSDNAAVLTALGNDYGYETVFSRQVEAYGQKGGVLLGLSTSGNSKNMVEAFKQAKKQGLTTIALTGLNGGLLAPMSDILFDMPSTETPLIQQAHILLYHYFCEKIEQEFSVILNKN